MPNLINNLIVRELKGAFEAEGMVFASLNGLTVAETEELRDSLAEAGVRLRMVRNRLATLALKEHGYDAPADLFKGNVGACWGDAEETINAAKVLHKSDHRKSGKVVLKGGVFEGNVLDDKEAVALAALPGRDELRAKIVGTIAAPLQQLVGVLAAPQGALARVVQAKVDAGGGAEGDA